MKNYFKVVASYQGVLEDGQLGTVKEVFLIESDNYPDAYYSVNEIASQTAEEPSSVDILKIERLDKLTALMINDKIEHTDSVKNGYIELDASKEENMLYAIKVQFTIETEKKPKKTIDTYFAPADSTVLAIKHVNASISDSPFEHQVVDTKLTKIDTVLLTTATYQKLISEYDTLKSKLS